MTSVFTAVGAENNYETAVTKTAATSVKLSSHHSKISLSVPLALKKISKSQIPRRKVTKNKSSIRVDKEIDKKKRAHPLK